MRKKIVFALSITLVAILTLGFAHAGNFILYDNNFYWGNNTSWSDTEQWTERTPPAPLTTNDKKDVVGVPDISKGTVVTDGSGILQEVTFDYSGWTSSLVDKRGDLFIDIGADDTWDWVVLGTGSYANGDPRGVGVNQGDIYQFTTPISAKKGVNNIAYVQSQDAWNISGGIRNSHPVWYNTSSNLASKLLTGDGASVSGLSGIGTSPVKFSSLSEIGNFELKPFTISWTPMCANDVFRETAPIPEPTTMLLLGSGLIGLAGFRRKFKKG